METGTEFKTLDFRRPTGGSKQVQFSWDFDIVKPRPAPSSLML